MHPFPHRYQVSSSVAPTGDVVLTSPGLPPMPTAKPVEFDGPGHLWSPETLFVAAVTDCFVLTFRGIAAGSKLVWTSLSCEVDGVLTRVEGVTRFTEVTIHARLTVPDVAAAGRAPRLLAKAEETCLITRSLTSTVHLDAQVMVADAVRLDAEVCAV
jgi:organic hydroperoxide reductase OsmC/OhrA